MHRTDCSNLSDFDPNRLQPKNLHICAGQLVVLNTSITCLSRFIRLIKRSISERLLSFTLTLTHGHFDHVGGCGVLFEKGAHICCGEREKDLIFSILKYGLFSLSKASAEFAPCPQ